MADDVPARNLNIIAPVCNPAGYNAARVPLERAYCARGNFIAQAWRTAPMAQGGTMALRKAE